MKMSLCTKFSGNMHEEPVATLTWPRILWQRMPMGCHIVM